MGTGTIVIGVDGSEGSATALRWAADEAQRRGWSLRAVTAWDYLDQRRHGAKAEFDPAYGEAKALAALRDDVVAALGEEAAAGVELAAVNAHPSKGLLAAATEAGADLLVVGARASWGFFDRLLGSVSQDVAHHATIPVAVVRPGPEGAVPGRVVVGVDGSERARTAVAWAAEHARLAGGELEVVHGWRPWIGTPTPFAMTPFDVGSLREAAAEVLDTEVAAVGDGVAVHGSLLEGSGASALLEAARLAETVVVGARGMGGFAGLLLGSTSHQVLRHAPGTVVVVPNGTEGSER